MELSAKYLNAASANVRHTDAEAAVFHRASDSGLGVPLQNRANRVERLDERGGFVRILSVGQDLPGTNPVFVAELKRRHTDHFRELVEIALGGKAALGHAEAAKRAARRVIGIVGVALNINILVVIWPCRVGTGTLQHGASKGGVRSAVRDDAGTHGGEISVFVASGGKIHLHRVAFRVDQQTVRTGKTHLDRALE